MKLNSKNPRGQTQKTKKDLIRLLSCYYNLVFLIINNNNKTKSYLIHNKHNISVVFPFIISKKEYNYFMLI